MSENCFHEFDSSGDINMFDETKLNKRDSLETDAVPLDDDNDNLCRQFDEVKINSQSTVADEPQVEDKPFEAQSEQQNAESGSKTPDLHVLQHVSEREPGAGYHVNGRCADEGNAAGGACGGSGNTSEGTVDTAQQAKVPHTPSPIQESTSPLLKPTNQEPPVEEEHYDILLLFSKHDKSEAQQFLDIAKRANWKVATSDDFLPMQTKFKSFEYVYKNSTYTVLLLTSNFVTDVWCEHRYQTALTQSIENPAKRCSVIPIVCQDEHLKMPLELSSLQEVNLKNLKIEKILQKTIKVEKRVQRETAEKDKRK